MSTSEQIDIRYPEHAKLSARASEHDTLTQFFEWLSDQNEEWPALCRYVERKDEDGQVRERYSGYEPMCDWRLARLIAKYLGVDGKALEAEKREMLKELRGAS